MIATTPTKVEKAAFAGRRSDPRIECRLRAEVIVNGRVNTLTPVLIRNLSPSGLQVRSTFSLGIQSTVRLKVPGFVIFGSVWYSNKLDEGFESGIEVTEILSRDGRGERLTYPQIEELIALSRMA